MSRTLPSVALALLLLAGFAPAQEQDPVHIDPRVPEKMPRKAARPPAPASGASTEEKAGPLTPGESSSRDTKMDLTPPKNEARAYPDSGPDDVNEVHNWNPHRAQKDVEVGDFYYKRGNYRGALSRYESALSFQDNDAEAMWKAGLAAEKLNQRDKALQYYQQYLKTLPRGERANDAQKAVARLSH